MVTKAVTEDTKLDRVAARVPGDVKRRWQTAALMRGISLTDFLIAAANKETEEIFTGHERIELLERDQVAFANMLLEPPQINKMMQNAVTKRLKQMKVS